MTELRITMKKRLTKHLPPGLAEELLGLAVIGKLTPENSAAVLERFGIPDALDEIKRWEALPLSEDQLRLKRHLQAANKLFHDRDPAVIARKAQEMEEWEKNPLRKLWVDNDPPAVDPYPCSNCGTMTVASNDERLCIMCQSFED